MGKRFSPFMAGDYVGATEWKLMYLLEQEEAQADLVAIHDQITTDRSPLRIEVLS